MKLDSHDDLFGQLLSVLSEEELIRLEYRARKNHFWSLAEELGKELAGRQNRDELP